MITTVPMSDVLIAFETGKRPKGGAVEAGVPSLGGEHVNAVGSLQLEPMRYVPESFFLRMKNGLLRTDDILIVKDGATTGRVGIVEKTFPYARASINEHLFLVRPDSKRVAPRFLYYYLRSSRGQSQVMSDFRGAAQGGISREVAEKVTIPLMSMDRQHAIIDLLSRAENIVRMRREAEAKAKEIIPALFLDMFGDPATNPKGWDVKPLGKVVASTDSGKSPKCLDQPRQSDEWAVLKLGSVTWGDYDETQHKTLPPDVPAFPSSEVHIGDVLLSRKNTYELVGAAAYVWRTGGRVLLPDLIFRLNIGDSGVLDAMYLWALLSTESKRRQLRGLASGAAASMPNISKARLANLPLEVPPIRRQRQFGALVIDAHDLGSQQIGASAAAAQTFRSLLAGVFPVGCAT